MGEHLMFVWAIPVNVLLRCLYLQEDVMKNLCYGSLNRYVKFGLVVGG